MEYSSVTTASVAKYGLTAIANCTSSEEARNQLMQMGAGGFIVVFLNPSEWPTVLCSQRLIVRLAFGHTEFT